MYKRFSLLHFVFTVFSLRAFLKGHLENCNTTWTTCIDLLLTDDEVHALYVYVKPFMKTYFFALTVGQRLLGWKGSMVFFTYIVTLGSNCLILTLICLDQYKRGPNLFFKYLFFEFGVTLIWPILGDFPRSNIFWEVASTKKPDYGPAKLQEKIWTLAFTLRGLNRPGPKRK